MGHCCSSREGAPEDLKKELEASKVEELAAQLEKDNEAMKPVKTEGDEDEEKDKKEKDKKNKKEKSEEGSEKEEKAEET